MQLKTQGSFEIDATDFNLTMIFVVLGVMMGYVAMRSVLNKLVTLISSNQKVLKDVLGEDEIDQIGSEKNEIAILVKSFSAITSRLEENVRNLERTKKTLHTVMSRVGQGMSSMQNIDSFLSLILETVTEALMGKTGSLFLTDDIDDVFKLKSVYGAYVNKIDKKKSIKIDEDFPLYSVIKTRKPLIIPRVLDKQDKSGNDADLFDDPLMCAPLIYKGKVTGVLTVSGRKIDGNFTDDSMNLLLNVASQTAIAIENSKLNEDIEKTYFETVSALALAVDAKDQYSRGHLDRVSDYCVKIGKRLGLEGQEIKILADAARLHDLGKIGIIDDVLQKPGPLDDEEWVLMRKHPEIGESIIKPISSLGPLCDLIRHHHEKLDGSGYPDGLKGDEISSLSRIIAVADIYDALTTDRSYRSKFTREAAHDLLKKMKDKIDQDIVDVLFDALDE